MAAGAAVAGVVGSDDTVFNRPTELGDDGRPVLTAPDLLAYEGVTITLRASAPEGVFIGTAHPVDVADFVGDSSRIRLTSVSRTGVEVRGRRRRDEPPVEPASADFWTSSMSGPGVEELTLDRDASAAQWVIAPMSGVGPTTVSFGVTVDGLYRVALIVVRSGRARAAGLRRAAAATAQAPQAPQAPRPRTPLEPTGVSAADRIAAFIPDAPPPSTGSAGKRRARGSPSPSC